MRRAFCSCCNSCLDYQDGYDDDNTCWVCAECGAISYSETPRFPGVIWKCDRCGDLLNNQSGFNDYEDSWECEECGYENEISEDEIYDSEEDFENTVYDESIECPNCGADLTDQDGFDPDYKYWRCEVCDEIVENPENDDEEELYLCKECEAILNNQEGFDEDDDSFICDECGTENDICSGYDNSTECESYDDYRKDDYVAKTTQYHSPPIKPVGTTSYNYTNNSKYGQANKEVMKKGHSLVLWILLSCVCFCAPWTIPFIIYYTVSPKHYWHV